MTCLAYADCLQRGLFFWAIAFGEACGPHIRRRWCVSHRIDFVFKGKAIAWARCLGGWVANSFVTIYRCTRHRGGCFGSTHVPHIGIERPAFQPVRACGHAADQSYGKYRQAVLPDHHSNADTLHGRTLMVQKLGLGETNVPDRHFRANAASCSWEAASRDATSLQCG